MPNVSTGFEILVQTWVKICTKIVTYPYGIQFFALVMFVDYFICLLSLVSFANRTFLKSLFDWKLMLISRVNIFHSDNLIWALLGTWYIQHRSRIPDLLCHVYVTYNTCQRNNVQGMSQWSFRLHSTYLEHRAVIYEAAKT